MKNKGDFFNNFGGDARDFPVILQGFFGREIGGFSNGKEGFTIELFFFIQKQ
jgi:hypothetical protein